MTKEQGLSLDDIGGVMIRVPVGESFAMVRGLSFVDILGLFQRYPEARKWFGQGLKAQDLLALAPAAIGAVIAGGFGKLGDDAAEAKASSINVETQLDLLTAIGKATFRDGFGPFVKRLAEALGVVESASFGKAQATNSLPQSNPSSPPVSPSETPGD